MFSLQDMNIRIFKNIHIFDPVEILFSVPLKLQTHESSSKRDT